MNDQAWKKDSSMQDRDRLQREVIIIPKDDMTWVGGFLVVE